MKKNSTILFVMLMLAFNGRGTVALNGSQAGFEKLLALEGNWTGKDDSGDTVKTSFKTMVNRTMVMETLSMPGMEEMVTIYSVDGDAIVLVHYCPTKNQPRMRAKPVSGEMNKLEFTFEGSGNLPDLAIGHEHKLIMTFQDRNHLMEQWTWRKSGKDSESVYKFERQ